MRYWIESITKDECWVLDTETKLTFKVYYETNLRIQLDYGAFYELNSPVYYSQFDGLVNSDLVELIEESVNTLEGPEDSFYTF